MNQNYNRMAVTKINRNGRDYTALIVLDEHRKFTELAVFEPEEDRLLDRVVIARVEKVIPGIHAAFVRISQSQKAYLPLEHLDCAFFTHKQSQKKAISEGDELLVQVIREAVKTKDPVVSTQITLTGRYCLLQTVESSNEVNTASNRNSSSYASQEPGITENNTAEEANPGITFHISRKIKGEKRKELMQFTVKMKTELLSALPSASTSSESGIEKNTTEERETVSKQTYTSCSYTFAPCYEILLRTNSQQASQQELREDILSLIQKWESICRQAPHSTSYTVLNTPFAGYIRHMQSLSYDEIDYVYTDECVIYEHIKEALPYLVRDEKLVLYQDECVPLSVLYHIEGNMESLLSKKVWLPSGGNLIIEQVETMTVIDVNSAKSSSNREAMLKANLEAAVEIPRQLRLRNISGMIIVDFINLDDAPEEEAQFLDILKKELRKDSVLANFIDITKLGLVEITRKKIRKSLLEILI